MLGLLCEPLHGYAGRRAKPIEKAYNIKSLQITIALKLPGSNDAWLVQSLLPRKLGDRVLCSACVSRLEHHSFEASRETDSEICRLS